MHGIRLNRVFSSAGFSPTSLFIITEKTKNINVRIGTKSYIPAKICPFFLFFRCLCRTRESLAGYAYRISVAPSHAVAQRSPHGGLKAGDGGVQRSHGIRAFAGQILGCIDHCALPRGVDHAKHGDGLILHPIGIPAEGQEPAADGKAFILAIGNQIVAVDFFDMRRILFFQGICSVDALLDTLRNQPKAFPLRGRCQARNLLGSM